MQGAFRLLRWLPIAILTLLLVGGCNIFEFVSDKEQTPADEAEEAMRDGDYAKAREALAESVKDSTNSIALYLNAKAILLDSGINVLEIVDLIEGGDSVDGANLTLLSKFDDMGTSKQNDWYQKNTEVLQNLSRIYQNEAVGILSAEDIALDYTVSSMVTSVLGLRDTNRDWKIDDDDFNLALAFESALDGYDFDGGSYIDETGNPQDFAGLSVFLGDWQSQTGKVSASTADTPNGKAGYNTGMINQYIAFILGMLENSSDSIGLLISQKIDSSFDSNDIDEYIGQIAAIINFYWHNDGEDNDGDGLHDEELLDGVDNDEDGLIDEDTDFTNPLTSQHFGEKNATYFSSKINITTDESKQFVATFNYWNDK